MPFRILVIDDETGIREAIRMTLEYEGYKIDEARSGQEGLDKAARTPFDAILLDIKMPILDGIEVLENLRDLEARTHLLEGAGAAGEALGRVARALDEEGAVDPVRPADAPHRDEVIQ